MHQRESHVKATSPLSEPSNADGTNILTYHRQSPQLHRHDDSDPKIIKGNRDHKRRFSAPSNGALLITSGTMEDNSNRTYCVPQQLGSEKKVSYAGEREKTMMMSTLRVCHPIHITLGALLQHLPWLLAWILAIGWPVDSPC